MLRRAWAKSKAVGQGSARLGARAPWRSCLGGAILFLLAGLQPALALDPARSLAQYHHTRWTSDDGAPTEVRAIVQTPDGFLWLGADDGLYRYDGARFEPIATPNPKHRHGSGVNALLVTRSGALVVGFDLGGVGVYERGRFTYLEHRRVRATVRAIAEDKDGALWVALGSNNSQLARFHNGVWRIMGADWGLPPGMLTTIHPARDGTLWFGRDHWLGYLAPGTQTIRTVQTSVGVGPGLAEDGAGRLWIGDSLGVRRFADPRSGRIAPGSAELVATASRWSHILVDHDQNLWGGGFGAGLFRVRAQATATRGPAQSRKVEGFNVKDGLTGEVVWSVFEDREGTIWVGTNGGLDRFRHANVMRQPIIGADSPFGYSITATLAGAVLVGDRKALFKAEPGQGLKPWFSDFNPGVICEGRSGVLWMFAAQGAGRPDRVFRVQDGRRTEVRLPSAPSRTRACAVDDAGGLWVTAEDAPARRWDGARWRAYRAEDIPDFSSVVANGAGRALLVRNRRLFQADAESLKPIDYGAERFFPGNLVQIRRDRGATIVVSSNGLTRLDKDQARFIGDDRLSWLQDINGLARAPGDATWVRAKGGVTQVRASDLDRAFHDQAFTPPSRTFSLLDGLVGSGTGALRDAVAVGGDGRVWLATTSGVFVIDPRNLYRNRIAPPVSITSMTVDGKATLQPQDVVLPKGARSLQIDYAGLSLSTPERVKFRYKLGGVDRDWVDPGRRRQAFYTNLKPGRYVFQVKAANEDGVWNETGASLRFELPPTFAQSKLFAALCILAGALAAWLAYALRLRQVSRSIQSRMQDRIAERERIARDLHDTLLQGMQGLMLKFHAATRRVPEDLPAHRQLESALDRADDVMREARERVRSLRTASGEDLTLTLTELAARADPDRKVETRLLTEGAVQSLDPIVADEIEMIVGEALFNAYRHAKAKLVVIEVTYDPRQLGVRVRDDGVGIEQAVLVAGGRQGHFGLTGMRERAARIGGALAIRSRPAAGVEVELVVPSSSAYRAAPRRWWDLRRPV